MTKVFKALNNYFFGEDYICLSDALWFYGSMGFFSIMAIVFIVLNITF